MGTKPNIQQKLFGPFKGLNKSQTPMQRALPPSPNASPSEYASEAKNVYIDPKTAELVSRLGIEYVDGTATESTGGMFKFIDYDAEQCDEWININVIEKLKYNNYVLFFENNLEDND
jgi:hypothetical protein